MFSSCTNEIIIIHDSLKELDSIVNKLTSY